MSWKCTPGKDDGVTCTPGTVDVVKYIEVYPGAVGVVQCTTVTADLVS